MNLHKCYMLHVTCYTPPSFLHNLLIFNRPTYSLQPTYISKKPLHLSYKPNGLQVGLSGESYKPFGQRKQPLGVRNT